jgi:hypothetical protein
MFGGLTASTAPLRTAAVSFRNAVIIAKYGVDGKVLVNVSVLTNSLVRDRGGVVVRALRYKPTGRGFDSRWCHWNFSVT